MAYPVPQNKKILKKVGNFPLEFDTRSKTVSHEDQVASEAAESALKQDSTVGICFDIDGVFKYGGKWAPRGAQALRKVIDAGIPFCFMTNGGGGRTELDYVNEIAEKLTSTEDDSASKGHSLKLQESNMVASYTPWREDLAHLKDQPILIVGAPKEKVMNVMSSYGFTKAVHLEDYDNTHPLMNPFKSENTAIDTSKETWNEGFKAVCVVTDPADFFMALQIVTDVLLSSRPGEIEYEENHQIPIYFSNPDLLWKTQYPHGRFGQGAFRLSLNTLYVARLHSLGVDEANVQKRLQNWIQYGKPTAAQYRYTFKQLCKINQTSKKISRCYMVGDNPHSDMQGCVVMNDLAKQFKSWCGLVEGACLTLPHWSGVLVKTGVWSEGDDTNSAATVVHDVCDAVEWILKDAGIDPYFAKQGGA